MSENEPEKPKRGWGWLQWSVALMALLFLAAYFMPVSKEISVKGVQMKGCSNARQIIGLLLTYASDHEGHYPDFGKDPSKLTSNEVFRDLIRAMAADVLILDETIFSCPQSPFVGDKKLGQAPDFNQALQPGENHWMMVSGLGNDSPSRTPVVLENAAEVVWPPKWLPYKEEPSKSFIQRLLSLGRLSSPGRSWKNKKIIICMNDASAEPISLKEKDGLMHLSESYLRAIAVPPSGLKILDIEVEIPRTSSAP